jgi:glycosyltransferase involved in cell wall biosynthesis
MKPVLFVTGHAPADRVGAFALLHERENVEFALFGGRLRHGPGGPKAPHGADSPGSRLPFPNKNLRQRDLFALASSGRYRAVVCSTGGRFALPATWAGARAARVPLILWASLWRHPKTPAHALSYPALQRLYRSADAVVTYGPHVSAYVSRHGARNVHMAPQAVDNDFWRAPADGPPDHPAWPSASPLKFIFVGRPVKEKGIAVLLSAWQDLELPASQAALVFIGARPEDLRRYAARRPRPDPTSLVTALGPAGPRQLRNFYSAADVLVLPSISTRAFREPWGLVVNEAFDKQLPVIASDAVGAVAGGLVRDRRNGLVVAAGDAPALARGMRTLVDDPGLRRRLGSAGSADVADYTYGAWADGFSRALGTVRRSMIDRAGGTGSVV